MLLWEYIAASREYKWMCWVGSRNIGEVAEH
jgi:hypothetical protein